MEIIQSFVNFFPHDPVQVSHAINKYVPISSTCIPLAKYITLVVQNL